jgi:hypothetical protein
MGQILVNIPADELRGSLRGAGIDRTGDNQADASSGSPHPLVLCFLHRDGS